MTNYPKTRGRPRKNPKVVSLLFKFVSIEQIMEWCFVSRATAYRYKYGGAQPSKQAVALLRLHANGKVLPENWKGFAFLRGKLVTPDNKEFTAGQIAAYQYVVQAAEMHKSESVELARALQALASAFTER